LPSASSSAKATPRVAQPPEPQQHQLAPNNHIDKHHR
jgi:hypothetical protein